MRVKLEDVFQQRKGFITIDDEQEYKRCRIQVRAQGIVLRDLVLGSSIKTKKQQVCRSGDFVVAEIDAKVGGFGFIPEDLDGSVVSSHYFIFELDKSKMLQEYFGILISSTSFQEKFRARGSTNYAAIRPRDFLNIEIELPNLPEQQNRIQRYNLIHSITRNIQEKNNFVFKQSRKLLEKVLDENTFKDSSVKAIPLKKLTVKIGSGSTPKGGRNVYKEDGIPFIRSQNVLNDRLDLTNIAYIDEKTHERMKGTKVFPGDILLNITGGSIGRSCVVPDTVIEANVSQHVMIIRLKDNEYSNFIHNVFLSPTFQKMIMDVQVGISREGLSKKKLENFYIPVPNKTDLNSIEKRLVSMIDKTTALAKMIQSNLRIINQIEKAVIAE